MEFSSLSQKKIILQNCIYWFALVCLPLFVAGWIYFYYRNHNHLIHKLLAVINVFPETRKVASHFYVYCLPGALWLFALLNGCTKIFNIQSKQQLILLILLALSYPVTLEFLQKFAFTDGVFDVWDIVAYLLASLVFYFLSILWWRSDFIEYKWKVPIAFKLLVLCAFYGIVILSDVF